jgi:LysM repeat protein
MNNPNPFLPEGSFLEQKNKARRRLNIVVYFSISLSVVVLMALLIQGCRKPSDAGETSGADTNTTVAQLPTNPPDMGTPSNTMTPPPETNPPTYTPPPPPPAPPAPPVAATEEYTVVKGDTIATIAKNAHVSQKAVMDANPGVDPRKLKIGQKLHMPAATSAPTSMAPTASSAVDAASAGGMQTYKVKSGDTLTGIAKQFHVSIKAIQSANGLTTTRLNVGKVLKIPGAAAAAPAPAPAETLPPPSMSAPTSAPAPAATAPPAAH